MDAASLIGIISGLSLIIGAIYIGGDFHNFVNVQGMMIVLGGTVAATLITFQFKDVIAAFRAAFFVFSEKKLDPNDMVETMIELCTISRRQAIPIRSKLVLFVVDMSSSLRSGSRTAHFDELKRALFQLPSDVRFNVLVFDQRLFFFGRAKGLVAATAAAKAEVRRWLDGLPAGQHTDLNRSMASGLAMLREALEQNPKSDAELFVLTDGRETVKTMPFAAVRSQFDRLPKKRCRIHVVQLGKHGTFLLQQLASSTGGRYHETRAK